MSESTATKIDATARRDDAAVSGPAQTADFYLRPCDHCPAELAELALTEVQVLHSRLSHQLDWEHRLDPEGPHPVTMDRHEELVAELDTRRAVLSNPGASG